MSELARPDQLSIVIRWVRVKEEKCNIVESFSGFVKITDSKTESIAHTAKNVLGKPLINFIKD